MKEASRCSQISAGRWNIRVLPFRNTTRLPQPRRKVISESSKVSTKAWWVHTKKNPEALRAWTGLHKAGMDKFHADFNQHERSRHAISEGMKQWWSHTNEDPVALSIWKEAHKAGLDDFHADPVKHKRWRDAISEGMKSWWSHTKGDPEELRAWAELHKAGMDKFHACFDQHERWRSACRAGSHNHR